MATAFKPTLINPNPPAPPPGVNLNFGNLVSRANPYNHPPLTPQERARRAAMDALAPERAYFHEGQRRDRQLLEMLMSGAMGGGSRGGGGGGGGGADPRLAAMQKEANFGEMARLKAMFPYWDQLLASQLAEIDTRRKDDLSSMFGDATARGATATVGTVRDQSTIESLAKEGSTQARLEIERRKRDLYLEVRRLQMQMAADAIAAQGGGGGGGGGFGGGGFTLSDYKDMAEIQDRLSGRTLDWKRTLREVASQTAQFPGGKVKKKPSKKKGN